MPSKSIVVTIPKTKQAEVEAEEANVKNRLLNGEQGIEFYWTLARLPVEIPARIYFCWDGAVRAYHEVVHMEVYPSPRILMKPEIHPIEPVPMKGFQGFRYYEEENR